MDIQEVLDMIVRAIEEYPDGVSIEKLLQGSGGINRRTLQRRLAELVKSGRIVTKGEKRGVRYFPALEEAEGKEAIIPLSPDSEEIIAYISQPILKRNPVSYNAEFLYEYIPNETEYLHKSMREQLHIMGRSSYGDKPAGTFARYILNRLLVDLSWASSRLEGNTYKRLDTKRLIEYGQAAEGKDASETQMILNHKAAIEFLIEGVEHIGFNRHTILNLHSLLSDGLLPDPADGGRIRRKVVGIDGSVYEPLSIPQKTEEYFAMIIEKANAILDPFEQSFFAMVHFPYLQPFTDVNKRVSRLAANIPFIKNNLSPLSFVGLSERHYINAMLGVYEMNRIELLRDIFVWSYGRSCQQYIAGEQSLVPPDPFRLKYLQELKTIVRFVIQSDQLPTAENIKQAVPMSVREEDRERFINLAIMEFTLLHEGNIARFGIRLPEFIEWRKRQGSDDDQCFSVSGSKM
jgi:Fic family protein